MNKEKARFKPKGQDISVEHCISITNNKEDLDSCVFEKYLDNVRGRIHLLSEKIYGHFTPKSDKEIFLRVYHSVSHSHMLSICYLLLNKEKMLDSSAFPLVRILLETVYKAIYMYQEFDNEKMKKLKDGKYSWKEFNVNGKKMDFKTKQKFNWINLFPEIRIIVEKVDNETRDKNTWNYFNDFIHTQDSQLTGQIKDNFTIKQNFSYQTKVSLTETAILHYQRLVLFILEKEDKSLFEKASKDLLNYSSSESFNYFLNKELLKNANNPT